MKNELVKDEMFPLQMLHPFLWMFRNEGHATVAEMHNFYYTKSIKSLTRTLRLYEGCQKKQKQYIDYQTNHCQKK